MSQEEFDFSFDTFDDGEPDVLMQAALGLVDPFDLKESSQDTLGLSQMSSPPDHFAAFITPAQYLFPGPSDNTPICIKSSESDPGTPEFSQDGAWLLPSLDFDDPSFGLSPLYDYSPEYVPQLPPLSPDLSGSSPLTTDDCPSSPDSAVLSHSSTYDTFREGISYDANLIATYEVAFENIAEGVQPTREQVREFVRQGHKTFVCAVDTCEWHTKGWKREDRGIAHVLKEHFRVLTFPCVSCNRVYKWPHDLTKHRQLKHRNPGEEPPAKHQCSVCPQSFDKSSNLTRHCRNVHRKPRRVAKARQEH